MLLGNEIGQYQQLHEQMWHTNEGNDQILRNFFLRTQPVVSVIGLDSMIVIINENIDIDS